MNAAVLSCKNLLQARQSSVWLVDDLAENLVLRAATGYEMLTPDKIGVLKYPLRVPGEHPVGVTARIYVRQEPESADSFEELKKIPGHDGRFDKELHGLQSPRNQLLDERHPCQQFYGGPISLGPEQFGVLKVENKMVADEDGRLRFSDSDKAALDTVAAMLALALKHARAARDAQNQLRKYHAFTVHSIRNELMPIETATDLLKGLLKRPHLSPTDLESVQKFQKLGTQGLDFYLKHLLKFLLAQIDRAGMKQLRIVELLRNEVWFLGEVSAGLLSVRLMPDQESNLKVRADAEYLAAMFKELLRNARKAVFRRREDEESRGCQPGIGLIEVNWSHRDGNASMPSEHVCVSISDNGDATTDETARAELKKKWERSRGAKPDEFGQRGLEFARWVVEEHGGRLELQTSKERTTFSVLLPVA